MQIKIAILVQSESNRNRAHEVCNKLGITAIDLKWPEAENDQALEHHLETLVSVGSEVLFVEAEGWKDNYGAMVAERALTKHSIQPIVMSGPASYKYFPTECPIPQISDIFPSLEEVASMITEGPIIRAHAALWIANKVRLAGLNVERKEAELEKAKRISSEANHSFDEYVKLLHKIHRKGGFHHWPALSSVVPHVGA